MGHVQTGRLTEAVLRIGRVQALRSMRRWRLEMSGVDPGIRLFPRMTSAAMNAGGSGPSRHTLPGSSRT